MKLQFLSLFSRRSAKSKPLPARRAMAQRRFLPTLEPLEDRCLLSFQVLFQQAGFSPLLITDNGPGDSDTLAGVLNFNGSYGTFDINTTVGISKPVLGDANTAQMELHYFLLSSSGGTLQIQVGDTDFTAPSAASNPLTLTSLVGGLLSGPNSSVSLQAFADPNNAQFGPGFTPGVHGPITSSPFSDTKGVSFNRNANPYSLTSQVHLTLGGPGSFGADHSIALTGNPVSQPAALGDFVWHDLNANGVQDGGEPGIPNVTVNLLDSVGNVINSEPTDANGFYLFDNLAPGTYSVQFIAPPDFIPSPQNQGSDDSKDSDASPTDGKTGPYTLAAGETNLTVDAGFYKLVSVGDFVWDDLNANGIQDSGEPGINGVTLTLTGTTGFGTTVTQTTTTAGNGGYLFDNLAPGTYSVSVDASNFTGSGALVGYTATPTLQGGSTAVDSNPTPTGTTPVTLPGGSSDLTLDFGYYKTVSVGNFVWDDLNANGIQDGGEPGINGVTLTLTGTTGFGTTITQTTTTTGNGSYLFDNLAPGTYTVTVDASNFTGTGALAAYMASQTLVGADRAVDSNNSPTGTTPAALPGGSSDLTLDFGYFQKVKVGDFVWHDLNANGVQDASEPGINGVTLTLTGTTTTGTSVTQTTTTAGNGGYLFDNLPPGTYTVTVDASNFSGSGALVGFTASPTLQGGNTTLDSNPSPTGTTPATLLGGGSDLTLDFGYYKPATIGDFIWHDLNANGIQDAGETGVVGATVKLFTSGNVLVGTQTTGTDGLYLFTGLTPGDYCVEVTPPAGYSFSPKDQNSIDTVDSDADTTTGKMALTTLISGEDDRTWDAGLFRPSINQTENVAADVFLPGSLSGRVCLLTTRGPKRTRRPGKGIAGVTLILTGTNGTGQRVTRTTQTDRQGFYIFNGLPAGFTYEIRQIQPRGFRDGPDQIGTQGGKVGKDRLFDIFLRSGVNGTGNDFCEVLRPSKKAFLASGRSS